MFVCLTDVDEGAGPLTYAPGTHAQGTVKTVVESKWVREGATDVRRSDDAQMDVVVPKRSWITAIGPKGTVVLADTRGYHKGGGIRDWSLDAEVVPRLGHRKPSHIPCGDGVSL